MSSQQDITDGQRSRWISVFVFWAHGFIGVGIIKSLGMMLPILKEEFDTDTWAIGWITALIQAFGGLTGPFARLFRRRFGLTRVLVTCGAMTGSAVIMGSFSATAWQMAAVYMLLRGTADGVTAVVVKEAVGRCIHKNYATSIGFARTGFSIGLFAFAPLVQLLLNVYGWRGTMLIIGAIAMHLVVCGAMMSLDGAVVPDREYQTLSSDEMTSECEGSNNLNDNLDIKLMLSNCNYWSAVVIYCFSKIAYDIWMIYFVLFAHSKGLSLEQAAAIVTAAGIGNLVAKIAQGFIVDVGKMPHWVLLGIAVGVSGVSFGVAPWVSSFWAVMAFGVSVLIADGVAGCLNDVIVKQVFGVELLAGAYGWTGCMSTILRITLGFIPGLMYDITRSYDTTFVAIGAMQVLSLILLFRLRYLQFVN